MFVRLALWLSTHSPAFKRFLWRRWYQYLAGYQLVDWSFMNYGYSPLEGEYPLQLTPADEPNRYSAQLYHYTASRVPLAGLDVLEVGSGRGGGAAFVKRCLQPRQLTGVDFSIKAVRFCQQHRREEGLSFLHGDAEALPFPDESFDAVLNVESSHCYGSPAKFFGQVHRLLRKGGHFLFADLRGAADCDKLSEQLTTSGLAVVEQEEITPNVVAALARDSQRKLALLEQHGNRRLMSVFRQFAAIEGSSVYEAFRMRQMVYLRYVLKK